MPGDSSTKTSTEIDPPFVPPRSQVEPETLPRRSAIIFPVLGVLLGFLLPLIGIPFMVFVLDVGPVLSTGFEWVDSMLYSISGPIAIFIVAVYWGFVGAFWGLIGGGIIAGLQGILTKKRSSS